MKLLRSKKGIPIPKLYFITDRTKIKDIPKGVPYIFGDEDNEEYIVRIMEYEVLYQRAIKSGYPFNFRQILRDNGFIDIEYHDFAKSCTNTRLGLVTDGEIPSTDPDKLLTLESGVGVFKDFIRDSSVYVDITVIKDLNIFPIWLKSVEKAVSTNIQNFAKYDSNMYNKKLEGMYGGIKLKSPDKNVIIIDISGSIPRAVSAVCLTLAKNLSENFYADLLITGSKSTLYDYSEINKLNIDTIYDENGMDNDQVFFRELVEQERSYDTAIVFGDEHVPGYPWSNEFNSGTKSISTEDGKELCQWKIGKVVSFHTHSTKHVAGYADWFSPEETTYIEDWVKDLNREDEYDY